MAIIETYKGLEAKENFYNRISINTKGELLEFLNILDKTSIWRGISESKYKLYTSLQKYSITNDFIKNQEDVSNYIKYIIKTAKIQNSNFLDNYFSSIGLCKESNGLAILSILRHHGVPTPFLDWTRNPLVALFFAASDANAYESNNEIDYFFSLYEIQKNHAYFKFNSKSNFLNNWNGQEILDKKLEEERVKLEKVEVNDSEIILKLSKFKHTFYERALNSIDYFLKLAKEFPIQKVEDKEEDILKYYLNINYNITAQDGLFIINMYPNLPLAEAIQFRFREKHDLGSKKLIESNKDFFKCFDIHKSLKMYLLKLLSDKGIDKNYIYPDIYKLSSRTFNNYLEQYNAP
jgi:hypothetical protein